MLGIKSMYILRKMGKTLDSDMHFGVGRSGDWSIRTLKDTLMGLHHRWTANQGTTIHFMQELW